DDLPGITPPDAVDGRSGARKGLELEEPGPSAATRRLSDARGRGPRGPRGGTFPPRCLCGLAPGSSSHLSSLLQYRRRDCADARDPGGASQLAARIEPYRGAAGRVKEAVEAQR